MDINSEIGKKIKYYRKIKKITLEDLSKKIYKSVSTISKYENGLIKIDVESLYLIAHAFDININNLLYIEDEYILDDSKDFLPAFFNNTAKFYSYFYDGRINKIVKSKLNIVSKINNNTYKVLMYMNYTDSQHYQICENTYTGIIEHFDAKSNILLTNKDTPMEKATIQILASYLDEETKWGLWNGFSSRPMMPVSFKMFFSKRELKINKELEDHLKMSREDIKFLKLYNMLSTT
ncbi:helix-turn-helix transcriptional regulator [Peptoniphilus harei]|uniref:helix-turn-helix domain-containing protein n=1 Tax=Peptoniphilus TaxID=162289 RepID=UPI0024AE7C83|nr:MULTISPECIES: helix-turn-helix transcriptional regulator [Peptoniphilus]MDK7376941.1 helix-turn-helix transcriptional regulator [Peptoniphilus harei]MDK7678591.1 helix-turn-helix transcriptional regulator [Peptoniphilus harei]